MSAESVIVPSDEGPTEEIPEDWELAPDEELGSGLMWEPEPGPSEDAVVVNHAQMEVARMQRTMKGLRKGVRPSEFTGFAFRMPNPDTGEFENFSFDGRSHIRRTYDTPAKRILLICGRQVEKSTLLGNLSLSYMCLVPNFKVLYVSPSATQTKTFSNDRIKEPIETSPILKKFTTRMLSSNILEKQFVNRSKITLRYAFLNADRVRGIPAYMLMMDEFQDILSDNIPVIEQCLSHAPERWQRYVYSGTPKSLDNIIEHYRVNRSTQGEWVVPCDACGMKSKSGVGRGRFWNILGEKNIGKIGLICEKCHTKIDPQHPEARWAAQVAMDPPKVVWESYRIPQLMVPWIQWNEILYRYEHDNRDKFYNECLGISYDSGTRPLTQNQVKAACKDSISMSKVEETRPLSFGQPFYMGLDWGTGEHSYTVLTLGTYVDMKFRILFIHRFVGAETSPDVQLKKIKQMVEHFNVRVIGTDYGGGFDRNDKLIRWFGLERVMRYQYAAQPKQKVRWSADLKRWIVHRTEVMSDIFNAIKRGQFEFPRWEEFRTPYASDMLNIYSEWREELRMIVYKHGIDKPDDAFHSILYCMLGSMVVQPRPDIIAPMKEDVDKGYVGNEWRPVYQG